MAGSNKSGGQSASKRLQHELKQYQDEPNPTLKSLGLKNEDDLFHWAAVMKGQPGTAYEGTSLATVRNIFWNLIVYRRPLEPLHRMPSKLPSCSTQDILCHSNLPSKRPLQDWRDLPGLAQDFLVSGIHNQLHLDRNTSVVDER